MKELKQLGLTDNEIKVYQALIDLGPSLAGRISRQSGLHRRTVYDTTEMLIKKGLIGYILENNRRLFHPVSPDRLLEMVDERRALIEPVVLKLKERFSQDKEEQSTNFYKGKNGLRTVLEDQLNYPEILILGATPKAYDVLKFYLDWYDKKRKKRKVKFKIITSHRDFKKIPLTEIRYLPKKYENLVSVNVYGDKVAIILWSKNPMAIVIKNPEISKGYKKHFEVMWSLAKP